MASSGYVTEANRDRCNRCGVGEDACAWRALAARGSLLERNWEFFMGYGVCVGKCPTEAIALVRDEQKGLLLDV